MNKFEILKINFDMVKKDLQNNSIDLYVAKIELQTIVFKMTDLIKTCENSEMIDFLHNVKKLLDEVNANISILTAQEYFNSHNEEI